MISIYHTAVESKLSDRTLCRYLNGIPVSFQEKIKRYRKRADQEISIIGKALLSDGLAELGFSNQPLRMLRLDEYNRPYIDGSIDFNISHSDNHVVCALTESGRVGLDIEKIKPIDTSDYFNMFNLAIREKILKAPDRTREIYRYWTMVEAVVKADGKGMFTPISQVRIINGTASMNDKKWKIHEIPIGKNTVCHCAAEEEKSRIILKERFYG